MPLLNQNAPVGAHCWGKTQTPASGREALWGLTLPACPDPTPSPTTLCPPRPQSTTSHHTLFPGSRKPFTAFNFDPARPSAHQAPAPCLPVNPCSQHNLGWEASPADHAHSLAPCGTLTLAETYYPLTLPSTALITTAQSLCLCSPPGLRSSGKGQGCESVELSRGQLWGSH